MEKSYPHITLPLDPLFALLDVSGFDVSPATRVRVWRVLDSVGREVALRDPVQLRLLLAPVFARSAEEQKRFYEVFEKYTEAVKKSDEKPVTPGFWYALRTFFLNKWTKLVKPLKWIKWPKWMKWLNWRNLVLAAVLVIGIVRLYPYILHIIYAPMPALHPQVAGKTPSTPGTTVFYWQIKEFIVKLSPDYWAESMLLLLLAFMAAGAYWFRWSWRLRESLSPKAQSSKTKKKPEHKPDTQRKSLPFRQLLPVTRQPRTTGGDKPPYYIPFREQKGVLKTSREQFRLGNAMRLRQLSDDLIFDLPATLRATMDRGGYPEFHYRHRTRPTEYLFVVEEQAPGHHLARLFRHLTETLRGQ
ncbi:MAG TPA: hypothetical protein PK228_06990, partial [Saprospiraceae bacterium]|nr:hypothetical protein [Saprospiraceae bacterium]